MQRTSYAGRGFKYSIGITLSVPLIMRLLSITINSFQEVKV